MHRAKQYQEMLDRVFYLFDEYCRGFLWRKLRVLDQVNDAADLKRLGKGRGCRVGIQGFEVGYECLSGKIDAVRVIFGDFA